MCINCPSRKCSEGFFSTLAREKLSFSKLTKHDLKVLKFKGRERLAIYILKISGKQLTSASCRLIDQPAQCGNCLSPTASFYERSYGPVLKLWTSADVWYFDTCTRTETKFSTNPKWPSILIKFVFGMKIACDGHYSITSVTIISILVWFKGNFLDYFTID